MSPRSYARATEVDRRFDLEFTDDVLTMGADGMRTEIKFAGNNGRRVTFNDQPNDIDFA